MLFIRSLCLLVLLFPYHTFADENNLGEFVDDTIRKENSYRDQYRHPLETLRFFDVQPQHHVVEIWPGAGGWYTEILAPYLKGRGKLYAAHFNEDSSSEFFRQSRQQFLDKLKSQPSLYDHIEVTTFNPPEHQVIAPTNSVDRVLTFRNVHNWYMRGGGDNRVLAAFQSFHSALKPGGILGVVEHRLPVTRPAEEMEGSGYMHQAYILKMAEKAGFKFIATSEINANPKDSAIHPKGVWTLPPTLRLGESDKGKYLSIGESDRMTLKFIKP